MVVRRVVVRELADDRSFERGERYFADGRVGRMVVDGSTVRATVEGTRTYRVRLDVTATGLDGRCSCPYGSEGVFCKHCVAVSLAWLQRGGEVGRPRPKPLSDKRLRTFLGGCDQDWLADQLMLAARSDRVVRARLAAAAGDPHAFDDREVTERLERAIDIPDFVDYAGADRYFRHVDEALDDVQRLVDGGFPDHAIRLAEYALELLESAAGRVDDSDGGLTEALARAEEIHFAACTAGTPDPVELAERLVTRAVHSEFGVFFDVLPGYQPVLGAAGLRLYRELVEHAWRTLPPKRPDDHGGNRYVVTHLVEQLAETTGGTDGLVEVLARDVTSAHDVLRIAERLCASSRDDEALTWLERGLAEVEPDTRLRALAADIHLRAGRRDRAADLRWANLVDRPTVASYHELRETAADFAEWRDRALTLLAQPSPWSQGNSTLVTVLLSEGDTDAAWQAAVRGGCPDQLWLRLARLRGSTHPTDATPVLLRLADQAIELRNRDSYRHAAHLLAEAQALCTRGGRADDFHRHLAALRDTHRTKRALREELDQADLP